MQYFLPVNFRVFLYFLCFFVFFSIFFCASGMLIISTEWLFQRKLVFSYFLPWDLYSLEKCLLSTAEADWWYSTCFCAFRSLRLRDLRSSMKGELTKALNHVPIHQFYGLSVLLYASAKLLTACFKMMV